MKAFKKLALMLLMCLLVVPFSWKTAYASSGTITLSDPTVSVGESVSITVKATTTDSSTIGSVDMELTYDANILEFVNGSSATGDAGAIKISGTADTSIITYTLTFNALKAGTSNVKISTYDIKDSNLATIEISKVGSSTVTISEGSTESVELSETDNSTVTDAETQDTQIQEAATTQETITTQDSEENKIVNPPKKDVETEIAGAQFIICKIPEDIIPEGFEYIGYVYEGVAADALKKDNLILFYLNQVGEESTLLYLYESDTGGFYKYVPVTPSLNYSVIDFDENLVIPGGFTATEVSIEGIAVNSWQSDSNSEYYLLYLMTSEGEKNLYLYDVMEKTVQRYYYTTSSEETTTETDSYQTMYTELNASYNTDIQKSTRIIYSLIVLVVVLLIIVINLALKLSDKRHPIIEVDEEEEEQDYDERYEMEELVDQDNFEDDYDDSDDFELQIFDLDDEK